MKIIKRFISQRCLGYTGNRTIALAQVEYTDGTTGTVYQVYETQSNGMTLYLGVFDEEPYIERPI